MHILTGVFYRHIFGLFNGWRDPADARPSDNCTDAERADIHERNMKTKEDVLSWKLSTVAARAYMARCTSFTHVITTHVLYI